MDKTESKVTGNQITLDNLKKNIRGLSSPNGADPNPKNIKGIS